MRLCSPPAHSAFVGLRVPSAACEMVGASVLRASFEEKVSRAFGALGDDYSERWCVVGRAVPASGGEDLWVDREWGAEQEQEEEEEECLPPLEGVEDEDGDGCEHGGEGRIGGAAGASSSAQLRPDGACDVDTSGLSKEQIAIARLVGADCRLDAEAEEDEYDIVAIGGSGAKDGEKSALAPDMEVLATNVWEERCVRMERDGTMGLLLEKVMARSSSGADAVRAAGTRVGRRTQPVAANPIPDHLRHPEKYTRFSFDVPVVVGSGRVDGGARSPVPAVDAGGTGGGALHVQRRPVYSAPQAGRRRARAGEEASHPSQRVTAANKRRRPQPFL